MELVTVIDNDEGDVDEEVGEEAGGGAGGAATLAVRTTVSSWSSSVVECATAGFK